MKKKYDLRLAMRVQCGDLDWTGKAFDANDAVSAALVNLPDNPALLLRVHDGQCWKYIDFIQAMRIAGYRVRKTKEGYSIL